MRETLGVIASVSVRTLGSATVSPHLANDLSTQNDARSTLPPWVDPEATSAAPSLQYALRKSSLPTFKTSTKRITIPHMGAVMVIFFVLFFQVGKEDFRKAYWREGAADVASGSTQGGRLERASFWVERSFAKWGETVADPNVRTLTDAITPSVSRIALLNQTANVIDMTP